MRYRILATAAIGALLSIPVHRTGTPLAPLSVRTTAARSARTSEPGAAIVRDASHRVSLRPVTDPAARARVAEAYGRLPLSFEANAGQARDDIQFLSRGSSHGLYLTRAGAILTLPGRNSKAAEVVRMQFEGARGDATPRGAGEQPGKGNYFLGDDRSKWRTGVAHYSKIEYRDLYPGVDLVYYGNQRQLEYDLTVAPGADPGQIRMSFAGNTGLKLDPSGDLLLVTESGEIRQKRPVIYQMVGHERVPVDGRYVIHGEHQVAFRVAAYDSHRPLVIDPTVIYLSYLGGTSFDFANDIAVDSSGYAYVAGGTDSADFPYFGAHTFQRAAYVTKISTSGTYIIYSTFVGGSTHSWAQGIAVDTDGNAYITGGTDSTDFPNLNAVQPSSGGGRDAFVAKLDSDGHLAYSTFLGGSGEDIGSGIAVDGNSDVYVTGTTGSTDFPTLNPIQASSKGSGDAFLAKINSTGSALVYSTYIGGTCGDSGERVAVDSTGSAYITGGTCSTDFPVSGALYGSNAGGVDAFVAKVSPDGSRFVYATYLGGPGTDWGHGIAVDSSFNVYVTGYTTSTTFPTASPFQAANAGGTDAFVTMINPAGTGLVFSTYLGGTGDDYGYGLAVDPAGGVYVAGSTESSGFPIAGNLYPVLGGTGRDAFLSKLSPSGTLQLSTRIGGSSVDEASSVAVDANANAYVAGVTGSDDFLAAIAKTGVYSLSYDSSINGAYDAFVSMVATCSFSLTPGAYATLTAKGVGDNSLGVSVTTSAGCPWRAVSSEPWITFPSGSSGVGNGSVKLAVAPNTGTSPRSAQIFVAGSTFIVRQGLGAALSSTESSLSFLADLGGAAAPQTLHVQWNGPGSVTYNVSASPATWLGVSPATGSLYAGATAGLTVSVDPALIGPGTTTSGTITISAPGSVNTLTVPVTLTISPLVSDSALTFSGQAGGPAPSARSLTVSIQHGTAQSVKIGSSVTGSINWLNAALSGSTATSVTVSVSIANFASLAVGTYSGSISIAGGSGFTPTDIPVTLNVTRPMLSADPSSVSLTYQVGSNASPMPVTQEVAVSTGGSALSYTAAIAASTAGSSLSVVPSSGATPSTVTVSANPAGLAAGSYEGSLTVSATPSGVAGNSPYAVPVTFVVSGIVAYPYGSFSFGSFAGAPGPPSQAGYLYSPASLQYITIGATGGSWLSATAASTSGNYFNVSVNPAGLSPGTYTGTVTLTPADSPVNVYSIPVTYVISPVTTLLVTSSPVVFNYVQGAAAPAAQAIGVTSTGGNLGFRAAPQTQSGGNWLSTFMRSGTTPDNLSISVNPGSLPVGTYNGSVVVTSPDDSTGSHTIPVTLNIQQGQQTILIDASPGPVAFAAVAGGGSPASQSISVNLAPSTSAQFPFTATAQTSPPGGAWLSVSPPSGTLTSQTQNLTVSVNSGGLSNGTYTGNIVIAAPLAGNSPVSIPVTLVVGQQLAVTAACPAQGGVPGAAYAFFVSAQGGAGPLSWQLTSGPLPAGLSLNSATGLISGTPTQAGTFPIAVRVTDSGAGSLQQSRSWSCSIVITSSLTVTAGCPAQEAIQGVAYSLPLSVAGGVAPYQWQLTSGTLPAGLSLNSATGLIGGTPTQSGTFPITVKITDSGTGSVTYSCGIVVVPVLRSTAACPAAQGIQGVPYSFPITVTGGSGPFTYKLVNSALPPGLSLNAATGIVSGTPTASGTFPIAIQIGDSSNGSLYAGQSVTYSCNIAIGSALTITAACPASVSTVGTAFSFTITTTGGTAPYTFTLVTGTLPAGTTLNPVTGVISGTPTQAGVSPVTIKVTDSAAAPQTQFFTCGLSVAFPKLQIASGCPASTAAQGSPYSQTFQATGGNGQYTWTIVGSLPAGLGFNGTGISGTPTGSVGTTSFTIVVTSAGQQDSSICSITVGAPKLQITSACPADGTQGALYSPFLLTATGGNASSRVFSIVNGSLPAGLSLSGNTISGTPLGPAGASSFSIQVSDGTQTTSVGPCTVNITAALAISGTCPATAEVGAPLSVSVTFSGGKPPYTYAFSGAQWLTLTNGTVSGTPPAVGSGSFSVTVADSGSSPSKTLSCNFPIAAAPGISGGSPAQSAVVNTPFSLGLSASGGNGTFTWTLTGPSWLSLSASTGRDVSVTGTPPAVGSFPFSVTLTDSSGAPTATFAVTLTVTNAPPHITPAQGCTAALVDFGAPFSVTFTAAGIAPFKWTLSGPVWLSLSSTTGPSVTVSGTASAEGSFPFSVTVADSSGNPPVASSCTVIVSPPVIPPATLTISTPSNILTPATISLQLESPAPVDIQGSVQLTFTPNAVNPIDNPQVHFSDPCLRLCTFTVPAGATRVTLPNIEQGTVAGTIHVQVVQLLDGTRDVLPAAPAAADLVIPRSKPVITSFTFDTETASGFDIVLSGYSTTRDLTSMTITFTATPGTTLEGNTTFTVSLSNVFTAFYQSAQSAAGGSTFAGLRVPISISGDKSAIASVTVALTNAAGTSDTATVQR